MIFSRIFNKRTLGFLSVTLLLGLVLLNVLAWMQARSMTHFVSGGQKTAKAEALSFTGKVWTLLTGVNIPKSIDLRNPKDIGLSYELHKIKESDHLSLEAWFIPNSNQEGLVIMFHGYATCKSSLLLPAAEFHNMGYEVFLVDFHGSAARQARKPASASQKVGMSPGQLVMQKTIGRAVT